MDYPERLALFYLCINPFHSIEWNSRESQATVWRCITRVKNYTQCPARTIKKKALHQAIVEYEESLVY